MEQASDLRNLWNTSCAYDEMSPELFTEKLFGDPDYSPDLVCVEKEADRVIGFIMGVCRLVKDLPTGYVKLIAVHPSHQGLGIGTDLLRRLEDKFKQRGMHQIRLGESTPNYLVPGLDPRYTRAMVFFERRGYVRFGETWNLDVDLENLGDIASYDTSRFAVRRASIDDMDRVMVLLDQHWPAWKPEIARTFLNDPISLHVATTSNRLVAFAAYDSNNIGTGWFGPMGTEPDFRGNRLGSVLLLCCLADLKLQGLSRAIIPWVGPIDFYSRYANALVERVFYRYEKLF